MKKIFKNSIIICVLILLCFNQASFSQDDYYTEGFKAKESGDWTRALNVWRNGRTMLMVDGKADPRIGIAMVETVTEQKVPHFYEMAAEHYLWGFTANALADQKETVYAEVNRIIPLLSEEKAKDWKWMMENNVPTITDEIIAFWKSVDPTPLTRSNERLIEHWERIDFTRKNFTKSTNSPYATDDRGTIFVKYGMPDKHQQGTFGSNPSAYRIWADKIIEGVEGKMNSQAMPNNPRSVLTNPTLVSRMIQSEDKQPEFIIWFYAFPGEDRFVSYLFGGTTRFRLVDSVEDFISSVLFQNSRGILVHNREQDKFETILPGSIIQLVYYEQLSTMDAEFARRFDDLSIEWSNALSHPTSKTPVHTKLRAKRNTFLSNDRNDVVKKEAPPETSNMDKVINPINMAATQFRYLDDKNIPGMNIVLISIPTKMDGEYELFNHLIVNDNKWNEISKFSDGPKINNDGVSSFTFEHSDSTLVYLAASNANAKTGDRAGEPYIGKIVLDKKIPLKRDLNTLEISDIILGLKKESIAEIRSYPFPVVPVNSFSKNDDVFVYLEAYHLGLDNEGRSKFDIEFSLDVVKKRRFRKDKVERVSQLNSFNSSTSTAKETIGFDVKDLEPGEYEFEIKVLDKISSREKIRKGKIVIAEDK